MSASAPPGQPCSVTRQEHGVTTDERIRLVHAAAQWVAGDVGADILHIKGPIVAEQFDRLGRTSVDVDILIRPTHAALLISGLIAYGWRVYRRGEGRSLSHHATVLTHDYWKVAIDVHHEFPGFAADPGMVFESLWDRRSHTDIAGWRCAAPDPLDHALILALHLVRTGWSSKAKLDFEAATASLRGEGLARLGIRAEQLGAVEALALALPDSATGLAQRTAVARYWALRQSGAPGVLLWVALIRQEPNWRARARRVVGALEPDLPLGQDQWSGPMDYSKAAMTRWRRGLRQLRTLATSSVCRHFPGGGS